MKARVLFIFFALFISASIYTGFTFNDDDPKWSRSLMTRININPEGNYVDLPEGDYRPYTTEPRYIPTPQGVYAVGPNFRVHPTSARTQSETPITRHPQNTRIFFASANTFNVGGSTTFSTACYPSTDGGVTWFGSDTTIFNFGDPAPMIMHTGRFLISYITSTGSMGAAYSLNNGSTWSANVTFPGATTSADKNLSAVDGEPSSSFYGRCYTVYTEFGGAFANRIVSTFSTDGGVSWSSVIPVSPPPSPGHHHQGCDITVDIYGWVRVVWANCTTNGQNSTEDSLGWAESGSGGTSWADVSNHKVNINGIRSSDLLPSPPASVIRANGFPRIATDRTCLPSADDDYVVIAEKNFAPALDNADIVLTKTVDGGSSWSRVRVNQNAAGSYEYFPAVDVDETGAINVCYYSTRNSPGNDSAEIYLSRSTDGGATFVDIKVSDHKFKPMPITGTATGYQGDYIGITSGGAGKIIPYWCEQGPTSGGRYQAWSALIDITQLNDFCEDFSCTRLGGSPTGHLYEDFTGTDYWSRFTQTAYGIGTGSARFNAWSATGGTNQSLVSYQFNNVPGGYYLTFDHAYGPWSGGNIDSLIVERSANGGTTWSVLARLWGGLGANAGPLNTAPAGGQFIPGSGQWAPKIYALPSGTNKIRLRAVSGFGNDIWVDNVCVQPLPTATANSLGLLSEGMFIPTDPFWALLDTVRVYLHRADFPGIKVDSAISVVGINAVVDNLFYNRALNGNYYRVVKHRNCIETWSSVPVNVTRGSNTHYNFVLPAGQAYDDNQAIVGPSYRAMFSGDINDDNVINLADLTLVYNNSTAFVNGYVISDLTGDMVTNLSDLVIVYNNSALFVVRHAPPGAPPKPEPTLLADTKDPQFENDVQKQKHEMLKQQTIEQQTKDLEEWQKNEDEMNRLKDEQKNRMRANRKNKISIDQGSERPGQR